MKDRGKEPNAIIIIFFIFFIFFANSSSNIEKELAI